MVPLSANPVHHAGGFPESARPTEWEGDNTTGSKLDYTRKVGGQYELENASLIPGRPCADAVQRGPKNLTQRS